MSSKVQEQLTEKNITMEITHEAKEMLAEKGYDPKFGARPLRRVIQDEIEDQLSEMLLSGNLGSGDSVIIDVEDGNLIARTKVAIPSV